MDLCNCIQELANKYSLDNRKQDKNAHVSVHAYLDFYVRPFVKADKKFSYPTVKEIRLSKKGYDYIVNFKFCPMCGDKYDGNDFMVSAGDRGR